MRIDLFLKESRLVKRRAVAREMCEAGRVFLNGRGARPAKEVKQGDIITLTFGSRVVEVEVLSVPASPQKAGHAGLYLIRSERRLEGDTWARSLSLL